jgi:Short C-terminal domain
MPGLLRGIARTAVVAGTATAVSNGVSRRQAGRWAAKEQEQQDAQIPQQQVYAAPPPAQAPAAPAADMSSRLDQLQQLGALRDQGVLSDTEFETQKSRILNS